MARHATLEKGTFAYYDGFGPLVPCKVTRITADTVSAVVTAARPGYPKGLDIHANWKGGPCHIVPRSAIYRRSYKLYIAAFEIVEDTPCGVSSDISAACQ